MKLAKNEELGKLAIGNDFHFRDKNLTPHDVIIRTGTETLRQNVEKELGVPRYDFHYYPIRFHVTPPKSHFALWTIRPRVNPPTS